MTQANNYVPKERFLFRKIIQKNKEMEDISFPTS